MLQTYWRIATLRAGADALPSSRTLLAITISLYLLIFAIFYELPANAQRPDPLAAIAAIAIGALFYVTALRIRGLPERSLQTLSALFGAAIVINAFDMGLLLLGVAMGGSAAPLTTIRLMLLVWSLMIETHIVSGAMNWPTLAAAPLVIAVFFAQYLILYQALS